MLSIFLIGVALSMDAFSIAISIGTTKINKLYEILIPFIIGIFHFFMPLLGLLVGNGLSSIFNINSKIIISIVLLYLAIMMYKERKNENNKTITSILSIILIAFTVSIDSFSVGIGLKGLTHHYILSSLTFTLCSGTITYMGLILGKYSLKVLKEKSYIIGVVILLVLAGVNICKLLLE